MSSSAATASTPSEAKLALGASRIIGAKGLIVAWGSIDQDTHTHLARAHCSCRHWR